jgi:hypothetical protein
MHTAHICDKLKRRMCGYVEILSHRVLIIYKSLYMKYYLNK